MNVDENTHEQLESERQEEAEALERQIWRKHAPYQYDLIMTRDLVWPTLTVDWFPCSSKTFSEDGSPYDVHKLLFGCQTSGQEESALMVAEVLLPSPPAELNMKLYDAVLEEVGGYAQTDAKINIKTTTAPDGQPVADVPQVRLVQREDVCRARVCPQNSDVVAVKPESGTAVLVFVLSQHFWHVAEVADPQINLKCGDEAVANPSYPLAWAPRCEGLLASSGGASGHSVAVWDVGAESPDSSRRLLQGHTDVVQDVAFHFHDSSALGSASDDGSALVWDLRTSGEKPSMALIHAQFQVNCMCFSPFNPFAVASGDSQGVLRLWDLRRPGAALACLSHHSGAVSSLQFAPFSETVLASGSEDGMVMLWDLAKAAEGPAGGSPGAPPPALLFMHCHGAGVSDLSWSPLEDWLLASASLGNNLLHVWKMAHHLYK
eukprot:RCo004265